MKINPSYIYNKAAEVKPRTLATETGLPNNSAGLSPLFTGGDTILLASDTNYTDSGG